MDSVRSFDEVVAENVLLRARVVELMESVALLEARVGGFERERGQDSSNSSKPPSSDGVAPRKKRAVKRAEQRAAGRSPGKQPGTPGKNHAKRVPDAIVTSSPVCCRVAVATWPTHQWSGPRSAR